jgi:hypothetical protein
MIRVRCVSIALLAILALLLSGCASPDPRPTPPAAGAPLVQPWGSVPSLATGEQIDQERVASFIESLQTKLHRHRQAGGTGRVPYRALTLSGGGSRGAWGAGVLSGWTVRGGRPQFDVVTGISTGALMATHAFLGSEFDDDLLIYKRISNDDVFVKRPILSILKQTSALDTMPLRQTLMSFLTEETLDAVADEYRNGRRLFIGTTNLDANVFTVWDMGLIASSKRPDRLERYIDVVLASASFPIAFPPVYIDVDGEEGGFTEMHVDGGARESVFFFDFDLIREVRVAMEVAGIRQSDFHQELFLLNNGPVASTAARTYDPVEGKLAPIADATVTTFMYKVTQGSIYRLWVLAMVHGADFHVSFVPADFPLTSGSLTFDPEEQTALFERGYQEAVNGTAWYMQRAPANTDELIENIVNPASSFDRGGLPPSFKRSGAR